MQKKVYDKMHRNKHSSADILKVAKQTVLMRKEAYLPALIGGSYGADKARAAGESEAVGAARGAAGATVGAHLGSMAGLVGGTLLGAGAGALAGSKHIANGALIGAAGGTLLGGIGGGVAGYKRNTRVYDRKED
jgi:hypothetical protein